MPETPHDAARAACVNVARGRRSLQECFACPIANELLADVGTGHQHVAHAVKYAKCILDSGLARPAIEELAKTGGEHGKNCERDLHSKMEAEYPVQPFIVPLELRKRHGVDTEIVNVP